MVAFGDDLSAFITHDSSLPWGTFLLLPLCDLESDHKSSPDLPQLTVLSGMAPQ